MLGYPSFWRETLGPEYLGLDQLGGIFGRGIFLRDRIRCCISGVRSTRGYSWQGYLSGEDIVPAYKGLNQLGGMLGWGIFLRETLGAEYLGLNQLGGILVPTLFLED